MMNMSNPSNNKSMKKNRDSNHRRQKKCFFALGSRLGLLSLITTLLMGLSVTGYAQQKKITQKWDKAPLAEVLKSLEKADNYKFNFNYDDVNRYTVTADIKGRLVLEALNIVLIGKPLQFNVDGLMITVKPKKTSVSEGIVLKGRVINELKQPLLGVAVLIDGLAGGGVTDKDGRFEFKCPVSDPQLMFSSIGYKSKKVAYTGNASIALVIMEEDVAQVDEVTVIGYGERSRKEMIGSVSSVKADELKENPSPNVMTMLQGRVAGLEITNQSGGPGGGGAKVAIRGYTALPSNGYDDNSLDGSPLYVVDGIIINSDVSALSGASPLAMIDPATIESVEVLKDAASAAIYGSRAGNGVILITTKKGKKGEASFTVGATYSIAHLPKSHIQTGGHMERLYKIASLKAQRQAAYNMTDEPPYTYDLKYPTSYLEQLALGSGSYDAFWGMGQGLDDRMLQDSLNPFYNNSTDWFKSSFRIGEVINANVQAMGGSEKVQYMVNGGYYTETGIMHGSKFGRINFMSTVSAQPAKRVFLDARVGLSYSDRSSKPGANSLVSATANEEMTSNPFQTSTLLSASGAIEDEFLKQINKIVSKQDDYNLRTSLEGRYEIIKGLSLSSNIGIDFGQANSNVFEPSELDGVYNESKSTGRVLRNINIQNENLLKFRRSIGGEHNIDALLGLSLNKRQSHEITGYGLGGPSDMIHYYEGGGEGINNSDSYPRNLLKYISSFRESAMVSYFARVAYNYKQKYLIEASVRRDGSSMFGENNQYATFPAVAVGWNIGEEAFMDPLWWIDIAKLRASYGTSGQVFKKAYLAHGIISPTNPIGDLQGMAPEGIINKNLTWEQSRQYDFGLDLNMFKYRFNVKLDYYYKYTTGMLYDVALPGGFYYATNQTQNAAEVSNEGLELELKAEILRNTAFKWKMGFNISRNWNRFEKSYLGIDMGQMVIGRPIYCMNFYEDDGYWQKDSDVPQYFTESGLRVPLKSGNDEYYVAGTRKIRDVNGDGMIDSDDLVYVGTPFPKAYGGWTNDFSYKNFTLNLHFNYALGRAILPTYINNALSISLTRLPVFADLQNITFWQKEGDRSDYPAISLYNSLESFGSDVKSEVENVSYLKLQQIVLGYTLPKHISKKIGLSGLRFYITGENMFTLSNYSGIDPEIVSIGTGIDYGEAYPLSRRITLGATINF